MAKTRHSTHSGSPTDRGTGTSRYDPKEIERREKDAVIKAKALAGREKQPAIEAALPVEKHSLLDEALKVVEGIRGMFHRDGAQSHDVNPHSEGRRPNNSRSR